MNIKLDKSTLIDIHLDLLDEALEAFSINPDFFNRGEVSRLFRLLKKLGYKGHQNK